jgi:hypothetical protein
MAASITQSDEKMISLDVLGAANLSLFDPYHGGNLR